MKSKEEQESLTKEDFIKALKYEICIDFLEWMNRVSAKHSMAFETDNEDIVEMYLNKTYD